VIKLFEKIVEENRFKINDMMKKLPVSIGLICSDVHIMKKSIDSFLKSRSDVLEANDVLSLGNWEDMIRINSVREIENMVSIHPLKKEKYIVINGAEQLTIESLNALLKIVEEPPNFVGIIFATKNWYSLLPTIRSRLLKIELKVPDMQDVIDTLKIKEFSREEIWKILFLAKIDLSIIEMLEPGEVENLMIKEELIDENLLAQDAKVKVKRLMFFKNLFFETILGRMTKEKLMRFYERFSKILLGRTGFRILVELLKVFIVCLRDLLIVTEGIDPNAVYNKDFLGDMLLSKVDFDIILKFLKELVGYLKLSYGVVDPKLLFLRILAQTYLIGKRGD